MNIQQMLICNNEGMTNYIHTHIEHIFLSKKAVAVFMTKGPCTRCLILSYAFFHLFVYVIISSQNACYVCEEHKIEPEFEFFYDGQKFQRECVYMIDRT